MNYQNYIKIMRPKHYLKNLLVLLPLVFSGMFFNKTHLARACLSFVAFSLVASSVYILNDLQDIEQDKLHHKKKFRPIAAGLVSVPAAKVQLVLLLIAAVAVQHIANPSLICYGLLGLYVAINISYSYGLKNVPIIDISILAFGFILRVFYGGNSIGITVSQWLYLAILATSFYMGLGKRRNEIRTHGSHTRKVNKHYNQDFLDKNMYTFLCLAIVFYALWAVDPQQKHHGVIWTVPIVMVTMMAYSLVVEKDESDGDPISVLMSSKSLLALVALYAAIMMGLVYGHL